MKKTEPLESERPGIGRRELMELLGASVALAGLGACTQRPHEKIFPFAKQPPELTPGKPLFYATSMVLDGFAMGLLARSHDGRPTKMEGNPEHPASLGATGVYEQASVLDLYDPARVRAVQHAGAPASWEQALAQLQQPPTWRPWIVLPPQSSPLVGTLLERVRLRYPRARFCFHSPLQRHGVYEATRSVFGRALETHYDFGAARVTLSLAADFLSGMPMSVRWAREFARRRREVTDRAPARLYVAESMLTPTGSIADHRLAIPPTEVGLVAGAILRELVALTLAAALPETWVPGLPRSEDSPHGSWIRAVAAELAAARGESIVIAGEGASRETQVLALALNHVAGNFEKTVRFTEPVLLQSSAEGSLEELAQAITAREVDAALILDTNPVYSSDPELDLARRLLEVPSTLHLTLFANETSAACRWLLPLSHYLESWGDARARDGTLSFIQPLIQPLYPARSVIEVLASCAGAGPASGHQLLVEHWRTALGAGFDVAWPEYLRLGLVPDSALPAVSVPAELERTPIWLPGALARLAAEVLELNFEPSPSVYDGRFANNAWLLELPHPMTKQCWGNAAIISPGTAARFGIGTGHIVELQVGGPKLEVPVLVLPGHADGALTLELGYGQRGPALLVRGIGADAYLLGAAGGPPQRTVTLRVTGRQERLAITQDHADLRGRPLALVTTRQHYLEHPEFTEPLRGPLPTLLPMYPMPRQVPAQLSWAMTIDTTICTGCSSCVVACQAENNIPVVGKAEVERGREMHWLRIDRYFVGPEDRPQVVNQPMLCQHCEKAPCEYVCPVNATVHSPDGLNEMVYNRCIGTRFCSNNCPYKVRRFNWFEYTAGPALTHMQHNPDVTVRERGVMEKCTYCVQRIRRAEIEARIEGRPVAPGEVVTACQQACPTEAIQFGALEHEETPMVEWRREPRVYAALHDLGTRPRTQYLARVVNTNPELEP